MRDFQSVLGLLALLCCFGLIACSSGGGTSGGDCVPSCGAAECGDDGCGGSCGFCGDSVCVAGRCETGCVDECRAGDLLCEAGGVARCEQSGLGCLGFSAPESCPGESVCSGGACVDECVDQCEEGERRCSGDRVQNCALSSSGCTEWSAPTACAVGACRGAGECAVDCDHACAPGDALCDGNALRRCEADANGCRDFGAAEPCGGESVCSGGACVDECSDQCSEGAQRCSGEQRQSCFRAASGCTEWGAPAQCERGSCEGEGECVLRCDDRCAMGETRCNGPQIQRCEADVDGCLGFGAAEDCAEGICQGDGRCVPTCTNDCEAGAVRCVGDSGRESCELGDDGCLGWERDFCDQGLLCEEGNCVAPRCEPACPDTLTCEIGRVCAGPLQGIVLNEIGHDIQGSITINGQPPTRDAEYCARGGNLNDDLAHVRFVDGDKGYNAGVSIRCRDGGFDFDITLPPGTYRVTVSRGNWHDAAGVNLLGVSYVAREALVVDADIPDLLLEEVGHGVAGDIYVNGAPPTRDAEYCARGGNLNDDLAHVRFVDGDKGYNAGVSIRCRDGGFDWSIELPPGSYRVTVSRGNWHDAAGVNLLGVAYVAFEALEVRAPIDDLRIDEQGFEVEGTLRVNGAPPTRDAEYCARGGNLNDDLAHIRFIDGEKGYNAGVSIRCRDGGFDWSIELPPGTYRVTVSRGNWHDAAGVNLLGVAYVAFEALEVSGPLRDLVIDELGFPVEGTITVDGRAPTRDADYCARGGNLNDDLAHVRFVDGEKGYNAGLSIRCRDGGFDWSITLPPGVYRVTVSRGNWHDAAGVNLLPVAFVAREALNVDGPIRDLELAEVGHSIAGGLTVNGQPPTRDAEYCARGGNLNDDLANIRFVDGEKGYNAGLSIRCRDGGFDWSITLPPGSYRVTVSRGNWHDAAGVNLLPVAYVAREALEVDADISGLILDEIGRELSGSITVNGAPPTRDAEYCARGGNLNDDLAHVRFVDGEKGYNAGVSIRCRDGGFDWSVTLPPGRYRVTVSRGNWHDAAGVNLLPVAYVAIDPLRVD